MIATLITLLTSGAGSGIVGGIFGIFRQWGDRKERVRMAEIGLENRRVEAEEAQKVREHGLVMLKESADLALIQTKVEMDGAAAIANQQAQAAAQTAEFSNLDTKTSSVDKLRGSVRPVMAYWVMTMFNLALAYSFYKWADKITPVEGKEILLLLVSTLLFMATSITTFYYVSRKNAAP